LRFLFFGVFRFFYSIICTIEFFIWNRLISFFNIFFLLLFFWSFFLINNFTFKYFNLLLNNFRFRLFNFNRILGNQWSLIFNRDIFSCDSLFVFNFLWCLVWWTLIDFSFFHNFFNLFYNRYFFNNCNRNIVNSVDF